MTTKAEITLETAECWYWVACRLSEPLDTGLVTLPGGTLLYDVHTLDNGDNPQAATMENLTADRAATLLALILPDHVAGMADRILCQLADLAQIEQVLR